jgi:hypothetical protein
VLKKVKGAPTFPLLPISQFPTRAKGQGLSMRTGYPTANAKEGQQGPTRSKKQEARSKKQEGPGARRGGGRGPCPPLEPGAG